MGKPITNPDAERAVLGSMMRNRDCIHEVVQTLTVRHFHTDAHQKVFRAILDITDAGKTADLVSVANWLHERKQLEDVTAAYLAQVYDCYAPWVGQYVEIVNEYAIRRAMSYAIEEISRAIHDNLPVDDLIQLAQSEIFQVTNGKVSDSISHLTDVLDLCYEQYEQIHGKEQTRFLDYGFVDLDHRTHGMHPEELILVAARPGVGKTAFAMNVVRDVSCKQGEAVFIASLEQSDIELANRIIAIEGKIHSQRMRGGKLKDTELVDFSEAITRLKPSRVIFDHAANQNIYRIVNNARRFKQSHDIKLVVVDYVQLVDSDRRVGVQRHEQVGEISRKLKQLAKELKIPVLAVVQVNRKSEDRKEGPGLADLRESGSLEQDADTVIILSRKDTPVTMDGEELQIIKVDVAKQRSGPVGPEYLAYRGQHYLYENYYGSEF